jgi:hypothetical protein
MGMGGMMGGGFRSIPPTGLPEATIKPNQTRHLPTRLVSLVGPRADGQVALPAKGETLTLGSIDQLTGDNWVRTVTRRIAEDKAPPSVAQLALWHVANGFSWDTIARISQNWANAHEIALARQYVQQLRETAQSQAKVPAELGTVYWELTSRQSEKNSLAAELRALLKKNTVLGLATQEGIATAPSGPAVACRIRLDDKAGIVQVSVSDESGSAWRPVGKYSLDLSPNADGSPITASVAGDALAEGLLSRLAAVRLKKGKPVDGHATYKIEINNASPLILNGLAVSGVGAPKDAQPSVLVGVSIPPHKNMVVPATAELVNRLQLAKGIKLLAADLSGL